MCGIAGYFGDRPLAQERVDACMPLMRRRGPDDRGIHCCGAGGHHAVLLHSRLSIIDLDPRSAQPFAFNGKWLSLNGELYNYLELRKELEAQGRVFRTKSDTEVLLQVIDAWGLQGLDRCEGMWAFALYDEAEGSLTLCRDRFGEKPLYLLRRPDGLYFGSEVKYLRALSVYRPAVSTDQLLRYLVNGYRSLFKQPGTFFEGVEALAPGTALRLTRAGETTLRYWTPDLAPDQSMSFDDAVSGVRERLVRSVELRLRADVPLAFCMSGGVDSNALIAIAKKLLGFDVHGFTILNTDKRYEENDFVEAAVRELGLRHSGIALSDRDFLPRLGRMIAHHDAPVATISYYAHALLMEAMAGVGYRVSVSGTAADELFTGYFDHHNLYFHAVRNDAALLEESVANWQAEVRPILRNPYLGRPDVFIANPSERGHIYLDAQVFAGYLRQPWQEPFREAAYRDDLLRNRMLNELFEEVVPVILAEDDANAMYCSIENRSPFLDRDLFEFTLRIPDRHLIRNGRAKAVLREAVRGIVPDVIVDNPRKVGFNAPIDELLDREDPQIRATLLEDSQIYEYVRRDKIAEFLDLASLPNSRSKFLFNFVSAKLFLDQMDRPLPAIEAA
jgi:asparagine synthase (glutamine-hydrolysing)